MCGFIIGFFTILSSVFSIVFIELLFRFYCYYLRIFVINMQIIKYCLEGFFIMAIFFIVVVILKYKDLRLSENNLPSK